VALFRRNALPDDFTVFLALARPARRRSGDHTLSLETHAAHLIAADRQRARLRLFGRFSLGNLPPLAPLNLAVGGPPSAQQKGTTATCTPASFPGSDRGALLRSRRLRGVELPVALFDTASALMPGNGDADMVRASVLACSGDFLLRFFGCQGKDLISEARRATLAASRSCSPDAAPPT